MYAIIKLTETAGADLQKKWIKEHAGFYQKNRVEVALEGPAPWAYRTNDGWRALAGFSSGPWGASWTRAGGSWGWLYRGLLHLCGRRHAVRELVPRCGIVWWDVCSSQIFEPPWLTAADSRWALEVLWAAQGKPTRTEEELRAAAPRFGPVYINAEQYARILKAEP